MKALQAIDRAHRAWRKGDVDAMRNWIAAGLRDRPDHPMLNSFWAEAELLAGHWTADVWRTWNRTRWASASPTVRADYAALLEKWPEWDGTERNLSGVPVFVWKDGGDGDLVCFARYGPLLEALGAEVIWQARSGLVSGWDGVGPLSIACFVPLQSLPGAFGTTPDTIPSPASWLFASEYSLTNGERVSTHSPCWPPRRVACCWRGNPDQGNDAFRSIYEDEPRHWRGLPFEWVDLPSAGPWQPSVELLRSCDLLITVDTAPLHVAGTLGIPTWLLLGTVHYPIYGADGAIASRWYPSVRVFRQHAPGDWTGVLADVERELRQLAQAVA